MVALGDFDEMAEGSGAKFAIVVLGFNRLDSISRLLFSVLEADFLGDRVDLVISLDGGCDNDRILSAARGVAWPHGNLRVRRARSNLGLRNHVLASGALVHEYDAIIMLEDDLCVGKGFYAFAKAAIERYGNDLRIAGVSLYSPRFNEMAKLPFEADCDGGSVYALQSAQSWGQCWNRRMWTEFEEWYESLSNALVRSHDMPAQIYSWPESSWKKYAMKFLVENNKTWIYPHYSFSTNFSASGTHVKKATTLYQVQVSADSSFFSLKELDDLVSYDIFWERRGLDQCWEGCDDLPVVCDFYGCRNSIEGPCYLVTSRQISERKLESIKLATRPHERNIGLRWSGGCYGAYLIPDGKVVDLTMRRPRIDLSYYANLQWREALRFCVSELSKRGKIVLSQFC